MKSADNKCNESASCSQSNTRQPDLFRWRHKQLQLPTASKTLWMIIIRFNWQHAWWWYTRLLFNSMCTPKNYETVRNKCTAVKVYNTQVSFSISHTLDEHNKRLNQSIYFNTSMGRISEKTVNQLIYFNTLMGRLSEKLSPSTENLE